MSRVKNTPLINAAGYYEVYAPFKVRQDVVYKCYAIRTINEYVSRGVDPYETFYKPVNIARSDYDADRKNNASIVSLLSADNEYAYIPNTYIKSYPGIGGIKYQKLGVLVEIGLVPADTVLDEFIEKTKELTKKYIGVDGKAHKAIIPYLGNVSQEQHINMERTRRGVMATYQTPEEEIMDLRKKVDDQAKTIADLTAIIQATK